MGRASRKRRTLPKPLEQYIVEGIAGHRYDSDKGPDENDLEYRIRWQGYSIADDTFETSHMFLAYRVVIRYWRNWLYYGFKMPRDKTMYPTVRIIHEMQQESFFFRTNERLVERNVDDIVRTYGWDWLVGFFKPNLVFKNIGSVLIAHERQVNTLAQYYRNHPSIEIYNEHDQAIPIPFRSLIFRIENKNKMVVDLNCIDSDGLVLAEKSLFDEIVNVLHVMSQEDPHPTDAQNTETHIRPTKEQAGRRALRLQRASDYNWELCVNNDVFRAGETIMLMTGELCDPSVADECMKKEGEVIALTNFVRINDKICLDRRFRHGYDKFLKHSCDPNCFAEITFPYLPDETPLVLIKARRDIRHNDDLTFDWFQDFVVQANAEIIDADAKKDHILCVCHSSNCRRVLWVEQIKDNKNYTKLKKEERLSMHRKPFFGMSINVRNNDIQKDRPRLNIKQEMIDEEMEDQNMNEDDLPDIDMDRDEVMRDDDEDVEVEDEGEYDQGDGGGGSKGKKDDRRQDNEDTDDRMSCDEE